MISAESRKQKSIEKLNELDIPYIEHLPVIETSDSFEARTVEEVVRRAAASFFTIQHACDIMAETDVEQSKEFFLSMLDKWGLMDDLTNKEKAIFDGTSSNQDAINMVWKYEANYPLLWYLGLIDELDVPNHICDTNTVIQIFQNNASVEELCKASTLRDVEELLDEADLIYRYNWACVDHRVNQNKDPNLDPGVVYERHWGLNWLIRYDEDWDFVSTDT
ncbi:DUF4272 domain-containing protein [Breznakia pachnodae]|uniref:DUF4272 domain-containing protein n=1 Tax=Breznakia pachnodae TaxID=265178 RepID=A0ABU0E1D2_9FIRM|nr:DUF4272 domain-containing protein [Breznakia pachnodae]MDQ0360691.1 hypothetical protein [Breznakia pachnodae]